MKAKRCRVYVAAVMLFLLSFFATVLTFAQVADKAQIQQEFRRRLSESDGISVLVSVITKEKSEEESMTSQLQEDVEQELYPVSDTEFVYVTSDVDVKMMFVKDSNGKATKLKADAEGKTYTAERIEND